MRRRRKARSSIIGVIFSALLWVVLAPYKTVKWLLLKETSSKVVDSYGYVYLKEFNTTEHRYIASQLMGRKLAPNEVVHHINGSETDNRLINLCLMDRDKHEHLHAWLSWQKSKKGRYPKIAEQKKVLETEYSGILLEKVPLLSSKALLDKVSKPLPTKKLMTINEGDSENHNNKVEQKKEKQKFKEQLFIELKKERLRLAKESNVPAYLIFHDVTLNEIVDVMPVSKTTMLQIQGVGPEKIEKYGYRFLEIVKSFKSIHEDESA